MVYISTGLLFPRFEFGVEKDNTFVTNGKQLPFLIEDSCHDNSYYSTNTQTQTKQKCYLDDNCYLSEMKKTI